MQVSPLGIGQEMNELIRRSKHAGCYLFTHKGGALPDQGTDWNPK